MEKESLIFLITYKTNEELELIKSKLEKSGFQKQITRDPFPEERPMRTGAFKYSNRLFRTHIHVVPNYSKEVKELLYFKKLLEENEKIKREYIKTKRKILKNGINNSIDYSIEKGRFIVKEIQK